MRRVLFTQLSFEDLTSVVQLDDQGIRRQPWDDLAQAELTEAEQRQIDYVVAGLRRFKPSVVNEATVWGRAIFPLLLLAETDEAQAQADVPLAARVGDIELAGTADGAIGKPVLDTLRAPFLVVVEAKRGVEGSSPVLQLLGEMLAASCLNAQESGRHDQRVYGCYTVADNWTFVRGEVAGLGTDRPGFTVLSSWELDEKTEAETIVKILKSITMAQGRQAG